MKNPSPKFFCLYLLVFMSFCVAPLSCQKEAAAKADVGVILDFDTAVGKISRTCISMALEDFYAKSNHSTKIVLHFRDSRSDVVGAASAAIDLLKNVQVIAILGPQSFVQADFVIGIGDKVKVPIVSQATSTTLSPKESPYFIRSAQCSSYQAKAIAAVVKAFGWRQVVIIYEDTNYGSGLVPFLREEFLQNNALVSHQSLISPSATNDQIHRELYKLMTMQTRVFVVHMLPPLASRFFRMAKEANMMRKGYAWIISDALTSLLDSADSRTIKAMQDNFTRRWKKRFHSENLDTDETELNVFGLWAYDSLTALAEAIDKVGVERFKKPVNRGNLTHLEGIGTSNIGSSLVPLIRNFRSNGLSGDFHIVDGQLIPSAFQLVNVIGKGHNRVGFWTEAHGISRKLKTGDHNKDVYSMKKDNLGAIVWPGKTRVVPKGWEMPTNGKKLRVGVPVKGGVSEFVKVERDKETNAVIATGFCIDVFEAVMLSLPYAVPYEFIPFETPDGESAADYNDLVYQIFLEKYDVVVGDVTISANRSKYVDFTFPYAESGVSTIVPIKDNERKNAWIFMKPLTMGLWLTIGAFFVYTGFVVWVLEHRVNKEFRGPPHQQLGLIFWFSFSTLVFAHKEKVTSILTRFVVIVCIFVVLVLTSSYTANLTSMLTVQQLQPTITNIYDLMKNRECVGYQEGSFVSGFLNNMKFDSSKFRNYRTIEEYDATLSKGSKNGGVAAIVDELPYIRLFLAKYCHKYTIVGPTYKTAGFGFAFRKGSPLVPDVSRAILDVAEGEKMVALDSFMGLFLIAGLSSSLALVIFSSKFFYQNCAILASDASIKQKLSVLARVFDEEKDISSPAAAEESTTPGEITDSAQSPISISYQNEGMFSQDEGERSTRTACKVTLGSRKVYALKELTFVGYKGGNTSIVREIQTTGKICPSEPLEWNVRYKIALGTARGLSYLHFDCDPPIIHRDIKPMDILLDSEMEPHILDLGIKKLSDESVVSATSNVVQGTVGKCILHQKESNVYAYGVVLLELITRKRVLDPSFGCEMDFIAWARSVWDETKDVEAIVDPTLIDEFIDSGVKEEVKDVRSVWNETKDVEAIVDPTLIDEFIDSSIKGQVKDAILVALRCTEKEAGKRPWMREVVKQLTVSDSRCRNKKRT
ncbi:Glutamate-gated kainate-type ion channel receptor subunit GluR5 [Handroanthus impetiginosus]|uniref:Glutamate-gated kainate-type ion channel receptor subunit GluR5 n=1 Tax=Handroanthus impetiginosus TaxID=429701 RepID=A0A2G9GQY9_9LAMI|nr:Glutamate-gated kainate-type ion channel receptor subunit GluR5 [Handroanthus impetiginosus]